MSVAAAGILAAGSLLGTMFGSSSAKGMSNKEMAFNAKEAQKNRDFQRDERLASQEFQLDMWNMNNQYNDIGSQIERARAAGVNPAALFENGYQSATSTPVTTTPQGGSMAQSNSAGAIGSAHMSAFSNLIATATGGLKQLVDSKVATELLPYTKSEIDSRVQMNLASTQKYLVDKGVSEANRDLIMKSVHWMDGLNESIIRERSASATLMYNQSFELFKRIEEIDSRIANDTSRVQIERDVADSTIALNEANASYLDSNALYIESQTTYQDILNKYGERFQIAQLTDDEVRAVEAEKRKEFANTYGLPLGSSEFEFSWNLHKKGMFEEYCNKVITPGERATWKPTDWIAPAGTYARQFDPQTGVFNPKWKSSEAEYILLDRKTPLWTSPFIPSR